MDPNELDTPEDGGFFLPAASIRRPVTVAMLFIACMVVGFIAYQRISLQLLPSGFTPPFLVVSIPTVPTTPSDIERDIVEPVESILRTVRNVQRVRSSAESRSASFFIEFSDGTDMTNAYNQVRDRLDRVRPELPPEVSRWAIWKFDPDEDPLMFIGARINPGEVDPDRVIQQSLVLPLERLPEVSRVDVFGARPLEIVIEVDEKRANAAGVSVALLIQRLQNDNFSMAAGTMQVADSRFPLRVLGKLEDVQALEDLPIEGGLRLRDVADIRAERPEKNEVYRVDGAEGFVVAVYKESGKNTVESARAIRKALDAMSAKDSPVTPQVFFDQGEVIEGSLDNLTGTAMWGGLFAILVLFFFLRRARMTALTALAIPMSLLITLAVMYFVGITLNALSLMGLMLSVGMVVDNSIVVTEAIQRRRMLGEPIGLASPRGAGEVGLAILVATSTTVVVFLPMVLMSGSETIKFYLGEIGFPVCVSLIASLVVSLVFIPLAVTWIDTETSVARVSSIEKIQDLYARSLAWCLGHRGSVMLVVFGLLASVAYPMKNIKSTDKLDANINDVRIFFDFEATTTFDERVETLRIYEAWLKEHANEIEVRTWMTRIGGTWSTPQIRVFLAPIADRELEREEIIERIKEGFPNHPGVDWRIGWSSPGVEQKVTVKIEGKDTERLGAIGENVALRLRTIQGVESVIVGEDDARAQELQYRVDPEAAQRAGVTPLIVGGAIDYALRGRRVGMLRYQGSDIPMWVKTRGESTRTRQELEDVSIPSPLGGPGVPIGLLAKAEEKSGYNEIKRVNGQTRMELQIMTNREDIEALGVEIDAALAGVELPRGYNVQKGDRFVAIAQDAQDRNFALLLAVVFVFLLMGILFESFILPFVIVMSIPFAFLGVYWTLWATGTPFDVMAGVGLIILVGIVVNNAIVLVDRVNVLIKETGNRELALVEGGRARLRPIAMTALTTIGGLIPMAIGASAIVGVPYAPLGRTVIGGLLASTVLTLYVVPLFYTLVDDIRVWLSGALSSEE
jgi:HAE1 family hydrophobic/amphiphilic exporter-1